ncbi:MAG: nitroreductase [Bacteroidales bacterium]|nr:nitroreductase [Bacteroidales bacterium]
MDFLSLASNRYSIRGYDSQKPVEKEKLLRVLEAGRMAPSAANRQPWTIVVVQSQAKLQALTTVYPAKWFADAPVVLIVKGRKSEAWKRRSDNYCAIETDLTIIMDHLILAATAEGLGTCWIAAFDEVKLREILKLTDDEVVFALTPIGYALENEIVTRPKTRKTLEEIVEWL